MLNFIVLGYVPGTSIQINFLEYICGVLITASSFSMYWFYSLYLIRSRARQIAAIQMIAL